VREPTAGRSAPPWPLLVALCSGFLGQFNAVAIATDTAQQVGDPAAIATDWQLRERGATLGASRITPTQARAFYRARGFDPDAASHYAAACVFQLVLRNDAGGTLRYRLSDWRIGTAGHWRSFVPLETWEQEWLRRGVSDGARVAFRWAQFPAEQEFAPGDWIMGMAALVPRPEGSFDLNYEWSIDGLTYRGTLPGLRCADAD
jgi:hypothetical protein